MSIVMLTKEQVEAIEGRQNKYNETIQSLIDYQYFIHSDANEDEEGYCDECECLNDIIPFQLAQALLVGYEIEQPKFEIGDWAVWEKAKTPFIINHAFSENKFFPDNWPSPYCGGEALKPSELRHATLEEIRTEKERRWWAELGREVGEFREGDARLNPEGIIIRVTDMELAKRHYERGNLDGFYPAESFKAFPKEGVSK